MMSSEMHPDQLQRSIEISRDLHSLHLRIIHTAHPVSKYSRLPQHTQRHKSGWLVLTLISKIMHRSVIWAVHVPTVTLSTIWMPIYQRSCHVVDPHTVCSVWCCKRIISKDMCSVTHATNNTYLWVLWKTSNPISISLQSLRSWMQVNPSRCILTNLCHSKLCLHPHICHRTISGHLRKLISFVAPSQAIHIR